MAIGRTKQTSPTFIERNGSLMLSNKSPSEVLNAKPLYLTCKDNGHLAQTYMRHSDRDHKPHVRSETSYPNPTWEKIDMRMTPCWSCKEPPFDNNQKPKPQSSHTILNEQTLMNHMLPKYANWQGLNKMDWISRW